MRYQKYIVEKEYPKLYYFLKDKGLSENYISNLRKNKNTIKLNGVFATTRSSIKVGDILEIDASPNNKTEIKTCILPLDVVFEDEYYLLVYKESGISCMPNKAHYDLNLAGAICNYMKDKDSDFVLRIINRLDKDTSGLILVAKSSLALQQLKDVKKSYFAICEGIIQEPIVIDKKIETTTQNGVNDIKRVISDNGKEAITYVTPIAFGKNATLIELNLIYGRTHQIRVHLSSISHSLIGDEIYGNKSEFINRTALTCNRLSFFHPYKEEILSFVHPLSKDFLDCMESLNIDKKIL